MVLAVVLSLTVLGWVELVMFRATVLVVRVKVTLEVLVVVAVALVVELVVGLSEDRVAVFVVVLEVVAVVPVAVMVSVLVTFVVEVRATGIVVVVIFVLLEFEPLVVLVVAGKEGLDTKQSGPLKGGKAMARQLTEELDARIVVAKPVCENICLDCIKASNLSSNKPAEKSSTKALVISISPTAVPPARYDTFRAKSTFTVRMLKLDVSCESRMLMTLIACVGTSRKLVDTADARRSRMVVDGSKDTMYSELAGCGSFVVWFTSNVNRTETCKIAKG